MAPRSTWTDTTASPGLYMIKAVTSLATGSVESVTPAVWSYSTNGGLNPNQINPASVIFPGTSAGVTSSGGGLDSVSPYGAGVNRSGVAVSIPNIVMTFLFGAPRGEHHLLHLLLSRY